MINQHAKKYYIPLAVSSFILLIIAFITILFFSSHTYYDMQGTNLRNFKNIDALNTGQEGIYLIEQTFYATNNELNELFLAVVNNRFSNTIKVTLVSWPENLVVTEQQIVVPVINSYQYLKIQFPSIHQSKNINYKLLIDPLNSKDLKFATIGQDRYPEGMLQINEAETDAVLVFGFQYHNDNPLQILLTRLSIYKPWLFQYPGSFITLFTLLIALIIVLVFFITKEMLTKSDQE